MRRQILSLLIVLCLLSTVEAYTPRSDKAKAQYAARVQRAKERQERIRAFYINRLKAYRSMLTNCSKCSRAKSAICNK